MRADGPTTTKTATKEQLTMAQGDGVSDSPFPLETSLWPVVALIPDGGQKEGPGPGSVCGRDLKRKILDECREVHR